MSENSINLDLRGEKVFLTGATGFIGSHLLKRLIREECDVHISIRQESELWRIEGVIDKCNCHIIDLTDFYHVKRTIDEIKPKIIYHLAAYGVDYRQNNLYQAVNTNINASINLFESFNENNGLRFIYTGTCLEYGPKEGSISEDDLSNPISLYGITKSSAVNLLSLMSRQTSRSLIVLRPFGIFGEYEGLHKFFPQLIHKLNNGDKVFLTRGEQIRDYLYIDDLIDAFIKSVNSPLINASEVFNIGSGNGISIRDIALMVARKMEVNESLLQFGTLPYRSDELMYSVADVIKAKRFFHWEPETPLEEGIENMVRGINRDRRFSKE